MKKYALTLLLVLTASLSYSQKTTTLIDIFKVRSVKQLIDWFEDFQISNKDTAYIALPKERFAINADIAGSMLENTVFRNIYADLDTYYSASTGKYIQWIGGLTYRGIGLHYARSLKGSLEQNFSLTLNGSIGGEIKWQLCKNADAKIHIKTADYEIDEEYGQDDPDNNVEMESYTIDVHYILNRSKFSYSAAMDQSMLQKKSCGSLMFSALYVYNRFFIENEYFDILFYNASPKFTTHDIAVGAGYGYNFVFGRQRFLLHVSAMPFVKFTVKARLERVNIKGDQAEYEEYLDELNDVISTFNDEHVKVAPAITTRFTFQYSRKRVVVGLKSIYNYYWSGSTTGLSVATNIWQSRIFFGFRF